MKIRNVLSTSYISNNFVKNRKINKLPIVTTPLVAYYVGEYQDNNVEDILTFLNNKNIRLKFRYMLNILEYPSDDMEWDEEVTDTEMQEWLETPTDSKILDLYSEVDAGILLPTEDHTFSSYRLLEKTLEHIKMYYDAFQKVDETEWKEFPGVGGTLYITSEGVREPDNRYYVYTTIFKYS